MARTLNIILLISLSFCPLAGYANNLPTKSVTIPIAVFLTPDPRSTHSEAVDCAMQTADKNSYVQRECRESDGKILYTSGKNGKVTVTVSAI